MDEIRLLRAAEELIRYRLVGERTEAWWALAAKIRAFVRNYTIEDLAPGGVIPANDTLFISRAEGLLRYIFRDLADRFSYVEFEKHVLSEIGTDQRAMHARSFH